MSQVDIELKSGKTITVRRDEIPGLRKAKLVDESKLSDELKKPLKNEDGTKVIGTASVGNVKKKSKNPVFPIGYVYVQLKSGQTIKVKRHEVKGLQEAGLLKDVKAEKKAKEKADQEAKEKEEKGKTKTKEEKGIGKTK